MSEAFIDYVMELLGPFGTVRTRRMFGGYGVYLDGLMFAIVSEDTLYLKADEMNRVEFEQAGCERFGYVRKGRRAALNFFRTPADAMESPELMLPWARTAYAAALRTNAKKQAAGQARAAAKIAPQKPAKKAPMAKPAGAKAVGKKRARPAKQLKRGKRTG
jgi:DNA transformation protein